jgi:ABC-type ATPase with predicted acetyltransferase domain
MIKSVKVIADEFTAYVSEAFDYAFDGTTTFALPDFVKPQQEFGIGLIVGSSGSGKTSLLKEHFGYALRPVIDWNPSKAVISHFSSPQEATEKLFAVGLGSIPTLCKPFHVLSNGEQYRAIMARSLKTGMIMDEFTSVVNRETAKSLCVAMRKYITKVGLKNIVLASCHNDIIDFLQPDWVFDCDKGLFLSGVDKPSESQKIAEISWYV